MAMTTVNFDSKIDFTNYIYEIVDENFIFELPTMVGDINFNELTKDEFIKKFTLSDMDIILYDLRQYIDELDSKGFVEEEKLIDQLELIKKYEEGVVEEKEKVEEDDTSWRKEIPSFAKREIKDWKNTPIESAYEEMKLLLPKYSGDKRSMLMEALSNLSHIVFSQEDYNDNEEDEEVQSIDDLSDSVMRTIEMILLPRIETIDRLKSSGGKAIFKNVWSEHFSEGLKNQVKDRDDWKCVVCGSDVNLHVHHKIPRSLGGVNHIDNLVTLCGSCHPAIETGDISKAFNKCMSNIKKARIGNLKRTYSDNKNVLKQEVEDVLDKILERANKKEDDRLVKEIKEVMDKLEIIFYD